MHQCLDGIGVFRTGKFFFFCLLSADNRHGKELFTEICIQIQHLNCTCLCLLCGCMRRMPLLPQEFSGTQKRTGFLFPAYYRTPLVVHLWQITVRLDQIFIKIAEQCLRSRSDAQTLRQLIESAVSHPCDFRCKSFHMILLFFQKALRNKHRHIYILYACFFESAV